MNMQRLIPILCAGFAISFVGLSCQAASPGGEKTAAGDKKLGLKAVSGRWGFRPAKKYHEGRPRVLLVGDSICSQYSKPVTKRLGDLADVDVWVTGKNLNSKDLPKLLDAALSQGPYDVIHFNIGLHGWGEGRIPKGQYRPLLEKYVKTYKKKAPGATLIWASTTTIGLSKQEPDKPDPVNNPTIVKRNKIAAEVMKASGVEINDLYALADKHWDLKRDKFHWNSKGVDILADAVAAKVKAALGKRKPAR